MTPCTSYLSRLIYQVPWSCLHSQITQSRVILFLEHEWASCKFESCNEIFSHLPCCILQDTIQNYQSPVHYLADDVVILHEQTAHHVTFPQRRHRECVWRDRAYCNVALIISVRRRVECPKHGIAHWRSVPMPLTSAVKIRDISFQIHRQE